MRVICNIPNGSEEISGVKFGPQESGQRVSEEISEAQGQRFLSVPGFLEYKERPSTPSLVPAEAHAQDEGKTEETGDLTDDDQGDQGGTGDDKTEPGADTTGGAATGDQTKTGEGKPAAPAGQEAKPDAGHKPGHKTKKK